MKELSIEEKAKRYDEAIKRLEDIETGKCPKTFMFTEGLFDYLFPELKESEDEKIRKILIHIVKGACNKYGIKYQGKEIGEEKLLDYLEKQGEQKQEWSDEDLISLGYLATFVDENGDSFYGQNKPNVVKWIRSFANLNPTQKQGWSEEDEKFFKTALWYISYSVSNGKTTDCHCDTTDWLKSLKDRCTWLPSDEQMEVLVWCMPLFADPKSKGILESLINDLKKLKG